jgi:hypothetical protein
MGLLAKLFAGGAVKSIENIATEWIETDKEQAEAKAVMIKTLDPNGLMRRELSRSVSGLYIVYVGVTLLMLIAESFGLGPMNGEQLAVSVATDKVTELFAPITTLFGVIVSASFGVNYANTKKGV